MDTRKVAAEYRLSQWTQIIQEQRCSGLNIKEFCQEKGMSRHAYFYWRRKLRQAACEELSKSGGPPNIAPSGWMQLDLGQQTKTTLDIEVGGCRVTVDETTDPELLKKVCRILRVL